MPTKKKPQITQCEESTLVFATNIFQVNFSASLLVLPQRGKREHLQMLTESTDNKSQQRGGIAILHLELDLSLCQCVGG